MWTYNQNPYELYHHGILGMKWGVRRYQNYDGTYTQAGMKRYNKALTEYNKANERYKVSRKGTDKIEKRESKEARFNAKHQLKKDYKHLKYDKLGDQGKALYRSGKTITNSNKKRNDIATLGALSFAASRYEGETGKISQFLNSVGIETDRSKTIKMLNTVGAVSGITATAKGIKDHREAKRLRAYYSHTSNY